MNGWLKLAIKVTSFECIVLGDLEDSELFSYIVLICEKDIYNAMKTDKRHANNRSLVT